MNKSGRNFLTTEFHRVTFLRRNLAEGAARNYSRSELSDKDNSVTPALLRETKWLNSFSPKKYLINLSILLLLFMPYPRSLSAQVSIRIFANQDPGSALLTVTAGEYKIYSFAGNIEVVKEGELVIISKYKSRLAIKTLASQGFICDSVLFSGNTVNASFTLRANSQDPVRQSYCGDLKCLPDLNTLVLINILDIDSYIAGVVKAEGGPGKSKEYLKTQAIIVRTYMYKYFKKHSSDGFNLCDNTHCQAFNGITNDSLMLLAAKETIGQVILAKDSSLIISAFHSNCGGETLPSEDVWLTDQSYLKGRSDPHCLNSRNARWRKSFSIKGWLSYLSKSGFPVNPEKLSLLNFSQVRRLTEYRVDKFSLPLTQIRSDMDLRSTFFSVTIEKDSVILNGKGYGHGVGLCQEGAMEMALKGFDFQQIIEFYYAGVRITDIKDAVTDQPPNGGIPKTGRGSSYPQVY